MTLLRFLFCQLLPFGSNSSIAPSNNLEFNLDPSEINTIPNSSINEESTTAHTKAPDSINKQSSNWQKLRRAVLPAPTTIQRHHPNDDNLAEQPMFSDEIMQKVHFDLILLNEKTSPITTFQSLYGQSLKFFTFKSYVNYEFLIHHAYESRELNSKHEESQPDLAGFLDDFHLYNDLRICECADYVLTVYLKLFEYHLNLYDMNEKIAEEKRDHLRGKQFDHIIYYRTHICRLLLHCNCLQRALVEIENGRNFLEKFQKDTSNTDSFFQFRIFLAKYTYQLLEASTLQHAKSIHDAQQLCEQGLKALIEAQKQIITDQETTSTDLQNTKSAPEKREKFEQSKQDPSKDSYGEFLVYSSQSSVSTTIDQFYSSFVNKYNVDYLLCQYYLLRYHLSRQASTDSVDALLDLHYYIFPFSFSLPCTIMLVEHFYARFDYDRCLQLIDRLVKFWWSQTTPREKLEFGKLKTLALIIQLQQGSLDSAIVDGYFAKRILNGFHENTFLIEACIQLTFALIGEMRLSHVDMKLQHIEYLSDQTMNCYAKLWYYVLVIDVAMELGHEIIPITREFLEQISNYRKKLLGGKYQRTLLLVYTDCILAQAFARLGILNLSQKHFHQALHQLTFDQMYLSNVDFRLQRGLLKLAETQLLHWYHTNEMRNISTKESFLWYRLKDITHETKVPWNQSRYYIYEAYYDRLVNNYRRHQNLSVDNDFDWKTSLHLAEANSIKLDAEWIKRLRTAWSSPNSDQSLLTDTQLADVTQQRNSLPMEKCVYRRALRPSMPHLRVQSPTAITDNKNEEKMNTSLDPHSHPKVDDWRQSSVSNTSSPRFQLYLLPVIV